MHNGLMDLETTNGHEKLINANTVLDQLEVNNGEADVIVTLVPPLKALRQTSWEDADSRFALQFQIATTQDAMLAKLDETKFQVEQRYDNLAGFAGKVTAAGLEVLLNDPAVLHVAPNRILEPHLKQGIAVINGMTTRNEYTGAGISIAICDTGIDANHPNLGSRGFPNNKVIGGYDFGDNDPDPTPDGSAHGTACAGIAAGNLGSAGDYIGGVAPDAKLYAVKISQGTTGQATESAMIAAWDWCVTHQYDDPANPILVISTSFGGSTAYPTACDTSSPLMTAAVLHANAAGITVVNSSGNDGYCDGITWPSCIANVISVGAVYDDAFGTYSPCVSALSCATKTPTGGCPSGYYASDIAGADQVTSYSNSGNLLDVFAPSNMTYTTDITGVGGYASGDFTSNFGGTSAACPYVAGTVAALQSAALQLTGHYLSPSEVRSTLTSTGTNITDAKSGITKPRIDLGAAIASLNGSGADCLTITNTGGGTLTVSSISGVPSWITLSPPPPYNISGGSSQQVCLLADCGGCVGSAYTLVISSNDNDTPTQAIALQTVCPAAPAALAISPQTDLMSSGYIGGPFSPDKQTYTLKNTGDTLLDWSVSANRNWVSVAPASGTLQPGASRYITVRLGSSVTTLQPGNHDATINFSNDTNGQGSRTSAVHLNVAPNTFTIGGAVYANVNFPGSSGIAGVDVAASHGASTTSAAGQGMWTLSDVPKGACELRFSKSGFAFQRLVNGAPQGTPERILALTIAVGSTYESDNQSLEVLAQPLITWYRDEDNDGYGDINTRVKDVQAPSGYVDNADDCNDRDPNVNPAATERCGNGVDENCDGTDDACTSTWYPDTDNDGYGNPSGAIQAAHQPAGFVSNNNDCDDTNWNVNPDAFEICGNGVDENCDGVDQVCPPPVTEEPIEPVLESRTDPPPAPVVAAGPCGLVSSAMLTVALVGTLGTRNKRR
jgi:hypothetical protein